MAVHEKALVWIGSSKRNLMALPASVRRFFGHALDFAQRGGQHGAAKPLKGFGGAGVVEIVEAVFVLHCFQKKSKRGIATSKEDMDIVRARLKAAEALAKELRHGKAQD
jgi:phage-related protein